MEKFKFLEHTADVKFQAFGKDIEEVFENCAMALKDSICGKMKVHPEKEKKIKIGGDDFESLLYNFLEEIIYLLDAEDFLISGIKNIEIKDYNLKAVLTGDSSADYEFTNNVKAVTYNEMFVKKEKDFWTAQVVLDV